MIRTIHSLCFELVGLLLWAVLLQACTQAEATSVPATQEEDTTERVRGFNELAQVYREGGKLLVIYGAEDEATRQKYEEQCMALANNSRKIQWMVSDVNEIQWDSLEPIPIFLIGTAEGNPILKELSSNLPVNLKTNGFDFYGESYTKESSIFRLSFFPHPNNEKIPLGMITGSSDASILTYLASLPSGRRNRWGSLWSRWGYEIYEEKKKVVMGVFGQNWTIDTDLHWDFSKGEKPIAETDHFRIFDHQTGISRAACREIEDRLEDRYEEISTFLRQTPPLSIEYHLYKSSELMALTTNRQLQGYVLPKEGEVHVIYADHYAENIVEPENHLVIRAILGTPRHPILETGLSNLFADRWQKRGALYWAARLSASDNVAPLSELLSKKAPEGSSYLVRGAMAAALVQFLIEQWGQEQFLAQYAIWQPTPSEIQGLESAWVTWLKKLQNVHPLKKRTPDLLTYYRGMTFAHEGYNIHNGYGSTLGKQSLAKIANVHANSIAIVPYSGTREISSPVPFTINQWAGGENDAAVVATFYMAKELGMQSLLKPQIWFPGSWPGDVEMKSEADWKAFFQHYRRWIRHYAMLAEIHEIDMFCVGVEFAKTTRAHPEAWRELIQDLRHLYQGPMTYGANWGEEIEQLAFGDELDFIGVDNYYPLSKKENPSVADLRSGFEEVKQTLKQIHKRFDKPILFTEVGFRSIKAPWKQPHAEANGAGFSGLDQARCYQVILEGIQGESWCAGMFWWKWPSYLDYSGRKNLSFSPCGKEAEAVLREGYRLLE